MARVTTTHAVDQAGLERLRNVRDSVVLEELVEPDRYAAAEGPFETYERTLAIDEIATDSFAVVETTNFRLAVPIWRWLLTPLLRWDFRGSPKAAGHMPWWSPPDRFDKISARSIAYLALLAIISGYLGTLLSQTLAFAGNEFDANESSQASLASWVRLGAPIALAFGFAADRLGRRIVLLSAATAGVVLATATAFAPTFLAYGVNQAIARGASAALGLLVAVAAAEETPKGSRAYVASILTMCAGLGSGMVVWFLPVTDVDDRAWRLLFLLAGLGLLPILFMWRRLPETRRFRTLQGDEHVGPSVDAVDGDDAIDPPVEVEAASKTDDANENGAAAGAASRPVAGHGAAATARSTAGNERGRSFVGRRFALLAITAVLLSAFAAPASTLQNTYLTSELDFSGSRVAIFKLVTSTPIGLGILVAGRIADRRGRRGVGAFGLLAGVIFTALEYNSSGWSLWLWGLLGTVIGAAAVPALAVYAPELFGTASRGRANSLLVLFGTFGSFIGLQFAGWSLDRQGFGPTFFVLAAGPIIVAMLVLTLFPETAQRSLEDIND